MNIINLGLKNNMRFIEEILKNKKDNVKKHLKDIWYIRITKRLTTREDDYVVMYALQTGYLNIIFKDLDQIKLIWWMN